MAKFAIIKIHAIYSKISFECLLLAQANISMIYHIFRYDSISYIILYDMKYIMSYDT